MGGGTPDPTAVGGPKSRKRRGMFAEPLFWRTLRRQVLPALRSWPIVRVWVAGCASGEEVWSLAVMLDEEGLGGRARLLATDADEAVLEQARAGVVARADLAEWTRDHRLSGGDGLERYFEVHEDRARLHPALLRHVGWGRHVPGVDAAFNEFSLIVFRHPWATSGEAARRKVVALLRESQARFGYLCVEDASTLRWLHGWEPVDRAFGIVRRVA